MQEENKVSGHKLRRHLPKEEKQKLIDKWKASKLTRSQFCQQEGLSSQMFSKWLKSLELVNTKLPVSFISMKTNSHIQSLDERCVEVKFPNGLQCRFSKSIDVSVIIQIAQGLANVISH
jgi:transposase-like protein